MMLKRVVWGVIVALVVLVIGLGVIVWRMQPAPNRNGLALGEDATVGEVAIGLRPPVELDGLTRDEVYALRTAAVLAQPELMMGSYQPSDAVFGQIVDGLPWWGMVGQWYYGSGERSIEGPSEEARFIENPYLLLWAEFYGFSFYGAEAFAWSPAAADVVSRDDFPLTCEVEGVRWNPRERRAEVTYDVTGCLATMNAYLVQPLTVEANGYFDLVGYNARDMNLNYLSVARADVVNVDRYGAWEDVVRIPHYIHQGGSCGYPGGCNNMSPASPALDNWFLTALPAEMEVRLWRQNPGVASDAPDMVVTLYFR